MESSKTLGASGTVIFRALRKVVTRLKEPVEPRRREGIERWSLLHYVPPRAHCRHRWKRSCVRRF